MATWLALFKKDFRLTRTIFFVGLVINLLILLLALVRGYIPILYPWQLLLCFMFYIFRSYCLLVLKQRLTILHLWLAKSPLGRQLTVKQNIERALLWRLYR